MKSNFFMLTFLAILSFACNNSTAQDQPAAANTSISAATVQSTQNYQVLAPADYKKALSDDNVILIDVRTPQEYASSHIEGAINVNVFDKNFAQTIQEKASKDQQVMVYCRSGKRSARATNMLKQMGYPVVYDLRGGYLAWMRQ